MRPTIPACLSHLPVRSVLGVYVVFSVAILVGCGGEPSQSEGVLEDTRAALEKTQEVERLAVRDAVGQMFIVGMSGTDPDYYLEKMIRERNIGGVLLFGYNMKSEEQTKELTESLQRLSMATEPATPFVAVDYEGGEMQSAPWASIQPSAAEVGVRADPEESRSIAERVGRELRRGGVNTDLAPVVDTGHGAAIGSRSYGDDPAIVGRMGAAAVKGFEEAGIVSVAKHFPNHSPALEDSHVDRPRIDHDMQAVVQRDLPPFRAAIEAGVPMVMTGHLVYSAIDPDWPAGLSSAAMRLLRGELGLDGAIVTDDLAMEGAKREGTTARAAVAAVTVGADLLLIFGPPERQAAAYDAVVTGVESGDTTRADRRFCRALQEHQGSVPALRW
ncbi:MAG: hypothetical protein JOZ19_09435 [Rubrobacter sp.]|nr:hypothetical protein [Rubrobacter sp.]